MLVTESSLNRSAEHVPYHRIYYRSERIRRSLRGGRSLLKITGSSYSIHHVKLCRSLHSIILTARSPSRAPSPLPVYPSINIFIVLILPGFLALCFTYASIGCNYMYIVMADTLICGFRQINFRDSEFRCHTNNLTTCSKYEVKLNKSNTH